MTEYLEWVIDLGGPYDSSAERIASLLRESGESQVLDLASGGAGPWLRLHPLVARALGRDVRVVLSDLHPNRTAFARAERASGGAIVGHATSVDATSVPPALRGLRTMFTSLHHLAPEQVEAVFRAAARDRRPFAAFELTHRSPLGLLMIVASLLPIILGAPFIRPFRLERLVLTWLIPLLPLLIVWDGLVSTLRTYTVDELRAIAEQVQEPGYTWEIGTRQQAPSPLPMSYVIGRPV